MTPTGSGIRPGTGIVGVVPITEATFHDLDRPKMVAGRFPQRLGEVALSSGLARKLGVGVGDPLTVDAAAPDQLEAMFSTNDTVQPDGPRHDATVVGVGDDASLVSTGADFHAVVLPRSYLDRFGAGYPGSPGRVAVLRRVLRADLAPGADRSRFVAGVDALYGGETSTIPGDDRPSLAASVEDSVGVQVTALWLFGAAAALASAVAVGHTLARLVAVAAGDDAILAALGLPRRRRIAVLTALGLVAGAAGAVGAVAGAVALSPLMPIGPARRVEPDPGVAGDWAVLGAGAAAIVAVTTARAAVAAWRLTGRKAPAPRLSRVVAGLARAGVRPAPRLGVTMALDSRAGRATVPARAVLLGALTGIAGLVAAFVFAASFDHLRSSPRLIGRDWDANVVEQVGEAPALRATAARLRATDGVASVVPYSLSEVTVGGERFEAMGIGQGGRFRPALLEGRHPRAEGEALAATDVLRDLDAAAGHTVTMNGPQGSRRVRLVGRVAGEDHLILDAALVERLGLEVFDNGFFVRVAEGADRDAVLKELRADYPVVEDATATQNTAVGDLERARGFPQALGAFLAVLAVSAVGHGVALSVRRRRRELAVVRALGFTRRQVASVVVAHASTVAVAGVVAGVPAGILLGRLAWSQVAENVGAVVDVAVPLSVVALIAVGALVASNLVAALPGRRAVSIEPATVLRAE